MEALIEKNYFLHKSAKEGYRGYVLSYSSHALKHIFDVHKIDMAAVAKSFGFSTPPRVPTNLKTTGAKVHARGGGGGFGDRTKKTVHDKIKSQMNQGGHTEFSANNPYGRREGGDKRQFTH